MKMLIFYKLNVKCLKPSGNCKDELEDQNVIPPNLTFFHYRHQFQEIIVINESLEYLTNFLFVLILPTARNEITIYSFNQILRK